MYAKLSVFQGPNGKILLVDKSWLFVHAVARQETLETLHSFNVGASTMMATVAMTLYWPNMTHVI